MPMEYKYHKHRGVRYHVEWGDIARGDSTEVVFTTSEEADAKANQVATYDNTVCVRKIEVLYVVSLKEPFYNNNVIAGKGTV